MIWVAILDPRVPKSSLFHKIYTWGAKKLVLGAFQEKHQNIMDFCSQNDRFLRGKTMLKHCIVIKKTGFGGSRKVRFLDPKFDLKKHEISHKICPWGALGSIFLIFWGLGTGCFFDGFRDRKKWVQNPETSEKMVPGGDRGETSQPSRGQGGPPPL